MFDGKPVSGGEVVFIPTNLGEPGAKGGPVARPARGEISAEGRYQLTSFQQGDGACPGDYIATIASYKVKPVSGDPKGGVWATPRTYGNAVTSDLKATVPLDAAGPLEFDFVLTGQADRDDGRKSRHIMDVNPGRIK